MQKDSVLGLKIAYYRKLNGLTQEELAEELNITQSSLNHFINSNRKPSFEMVLKICVALKLNSIDELF